MKKYVYAVLAGLMLLSGLAGCSSDEDSDTPVKPVLTDHGVLEVPGKPGYQLRYYSRKVNGRTHHIYILEKDGAPVAGADLNTTSDKDPLTITSDVAAPAAASESSGSQR